jgi:hypothetical protein
VILTIRKRQILNYRLISETRNGQPLKNFGQAQNLKSLSSLVKIKQIGGNSVCGYENNLKKLSKEKNHTKKKLLNVFQKKLTYALEIIMMRLEKLIQMSQFSNMIGPTSCLLMKLKNSKEISCQANLYRLRHLI